MNISPLGPLLQVMCGNVGTPKFGNCAFGVSATWSVPEQSLVSPQMWLRFNQCPTSCVAVRPRLNGALAVPVVPNAVLRIATPSVSGAPPGNCVYPSSPPPRVQTHRLRYFEDGQASAP